MQAPAHGGRLLQAVRQYGTPLSEWIDLSTGINPNTYPLPPVPDSVWRRLPEEDDALLDAASHYYGSRYLLPLAGSQAGIECLPKLREKGRVGILSPGFGEHAHHWCKQGHIVEELSADELEARLRDFDVVVVIRPNNPTTELLSKKRLNRWLEVLRSNNGWLVVDEAFLDALPGCHAMSMIEKCPVQGLIVLRSIGKFFGLAGIRLGFVWAENDITNAMATMTGTWAVSNVARWAGTVALKDDTWQTLMRQTLQAESSRLKMLLERQSFQTLSTPLFCTVHRLSPQLDQNNIHSASRVFEHLASRGILIRRFENQPIFRLGLPEDETSWKRLERALLEL